MSSGDSGLPRLPDVTCALCGKARSILEPPCMCALRRSEFVPVTMDHQEHPMPQNARGQLISLALSWPSPQRLLWGADAPDVSRWLHVDTTSASTKESPDLVLSSYKDLLALPPDVFDVVQVRWRLETMEPRDVPSILGALRRSLREGGRLEILFDDAQRMLDLRSIQVMDAKKGARVMPWRDVLRTLYTGAPGDGLSRQWAYSSGDVQSLLEELGLERVRVSAAYPQQEGGWAYRGVGVAPVEGVRRQTQACPHCDTAWPTRVNEEGEVLEAGPVVPPQERSSLLQSERDAAKTCIHGKSFLEPCQDCSPYAS